MNDIYVSQITRNDQAWTKPAGCIKKQNGKSFAARNGFQFDEWLFRTSWIIDGWHYAFLQGVHRLKASAYTRTQKFDTILYTMEPMLSDKEFSQRYVGQIRNVECLNKEQMRDATETAKSNGWLKEMKVEIKKIGGETDDLTQISYRDAPFNIRFKPVDLKVFKTPIFAKENNPLNQLKSFDLYELSNNRRLTILHPILHLI